MTFQNRVSVCQTNIKIRLLVLKCEEQQANETLSILYKNSDNTSLVNSTTACQSPTGIGTSSAVMPLFMIHSASLPRLNLPQVRIFPPASLFSLYPIHFIPYSWLHRTTFGPQQLWVRHPSWSANVPPQWLTLAPQIDVHMYEWRCLNCNIGQYSWSHWDADLEEL